MNFNREKFFESFRQQFGSLNQKQVDALNDLLTAIESDGKIADLRQIAYLLATIKHETAHTFEPIEEYGKGKGREYGKVDPETKHAYYGRGYVQLTWRRNYKLLGQRLDVDLVHHPELALEPSIAWQITSEGMRYGLFTGKDLDDYINANKTDYVQARKIINGLDQAERIAGYAKRFETILRASQPEVERAAVNDIQQAESPSSPALLPPPAESTSVTVKDGAVEVATNQLVTPPQNVAIEKTEPKGFIAKVGKKITALTTGGGLLDVATEKLAKVQALGIPADIWKRLFWLAVGAAAIYTVYLLIHHVLEMKRDKDLTAKLVDANSANARKVVMIDKDQIEEFKQKGYAIVYR